MIKQANTKNKVSTKLGLQQSILVTPGWKWTDGRNTEQSRNYSICCGENPRHISWSGINIVIDNF